MGVEDKLGKLEIKKVSEGDIGRLIEIYLESYKGLEEYAYTHPKDVGSYIRWLLKRDSEGVWKAEINGDTVGFIAVDSNWFSKREHNNVGAIHEIVVLPDYRGRGIGSSLVRKALEYFKNKGLKKAELWVGDENEGAKKLYKKLGFKERDRYNYWIRMTREVT